MPDRDHLLKLLQTNQRRLQVLELQKAQYSPAAVPVDLELSIENTQAEIERLEEQLAALEGSDRDLPAPPGTPTGDVSGALDTSPETEIQKGKRVNWEAVGAIAGVLALIVAILALRPSIFLSSSEPTPSTTPGRAPTSGPTPGPTSTPERPTTIAALVAETATSTPVVELVETPTPTPVPPTPTHTPTPTPVPPTPTHTPTPTPTPTATPRGVLMTGETVSLTQPIPMELIQVPAGEFLMGSDPTKDTLAGSNEQPQHPVTLPEFYIGKHEVTNAQYATFTEATGHDTPRHWTGGRVPAGKEDHPVWAVSWDDAIVFTQWLSEETGRTFRLCTEAEWEKACRGTSGLVYPWGETFDLLKANAGQSAIGDTTPVGMYSPAGDSPYGAADMSGNVWEWTSSIPKNYRYDPNDGRENLRILGVQRVQRGGSNYLILGGSGRCAERIDGLPDRGYINVGFRVCASPGR